MDVLVSGLVIGSVYALVALGFTFTWMTTLTLNFGQGSLLMLGALMGITMQQTWGLSLPVTVVLTVAAVAVISVLVYWAGVAPFNKGHDPINWILSTVAIDIALRAVAMMVWGKSVMPSKPFFQDDMLDFGFVVFESQQLVVVVGLLVTATLLVIFVRGSLWGRALTAVAQNRVAAALSGISPAVIATLGYALSGGLAALAGLLVAPIVFASANMGTPLLVKAFTVSVLAGLDSLWGAVLAGLLFGVLESMVARYVGSEFRDVFGLILLVVVLRFRPSGLFGISRVVKV